MHVCHAPTRTPPLLHGPCFKTGRCVRSTGECCGCGIGARRWQKSEPRLHAAAAHPPTMPHPLPVDPLFLKAKPRASACSPPEGPAPHPLSPSSAPSRRNKGIPRRLTPPRAPFFPPPPTSLARPAVSRSSHPLFRALFIFPSQYLFAIGHAVVFSLGRLLPPAFKLHSQTARLASRRLHPPPRAAPRDARSLWRGRSSRLDCRVECAVRRPSSHTGLAAFQAWALPASLAVTGGITVVFLSWA